MYFNVLIDCLRWSFLQFVSMVMAFFLLILGVVIIILGGGIANSVGLKSLSELIFSLKFFPGLGLMLAGYALFWYFIIKREYQTDNHNIGRIILFSLVPNLLFVGMLSYTLFSLPPLPPGCAIISPGIPFFSILYSLALFPAYVLGLVKLVFVADNRKSKQKRLVFLLIGLLVLGLVLIALSINVLGLEKFIYLIRDR